MYISDFQCLKSLIYKHWSLELITVEKNSLLYRMLNKVIAVLNLYPCYISGSSDLYAAWYLQGKWYAKRLFVGLRHKILIIWNVFLFIRFFFLCVCLTQWHFNGLLNGCFTASVCWGSELLYICMCDGKFLLMHAAWGIFSSTLKWRISHSP